ncbi:MAG: tyrosine-type recombinase/integrase [Chloroflexi bacterium]|nr:tyrosine-type recombinase/integrase [Chloroflexota bacterium]
MNLPIDFSSSDIGFGSWHVPRLDLIRQIVANLQNPLSHPEYIFKELKPELAKHNMLVSYSAVCLGLLNGLRPFEITRLARNHIHLNEGFLIIDGKARQSLRAYRKAPILPEITPLFTELKNSTLRNKLFYFYEPIDRLKSLKTGDLNSILILVGNCLNLVHTPDFYSFRHRFRTDMLAAGMSEFKLNYLMGHEKTGSEPFSIYYHLPMQDLFKNYTKAARQLANSYGILDTDLEREQGNDTSKNT